ncbi:adenosylcobinamide-phosphate synthase CbiB [uncultured Bacteroides sp.]|uniref:adenosylcobinamide-phosphate synthase CbiB n=1 Tax=uncultured Bacteroides sp. TaxID=162156 RepID=UPI002AA821A5|nr:adenosylcobinamide-phosphate synthase CbiB [uncultured Bacteroides sp.]
MESSAFYIFIYTSWGSLFALFTGWLLDKLLGDPSFLPHPVIAFGRLITSGEKWLNKGTHRILKGGTLAIGLVIVVYLLSYGLMKAAMILNAYLAWGVAAAAVFYCLAGTTLIKEVRMVFEALDRSLDEGRKQVARIVGRNTEELTEQEVRTAALETLAENLSDGVIAPLFWYLLLGVPGMFAYKMINTLDSMIGYRNERYRLFGRIAARMDDVANFIPARITALLMIAVSGRFVMLPLINFVRQYGSRHASPNSGYPEAALAGILNCRFGGPHHYFGELIHKPYIGSNERSLTTTDAKIAIRINHLAELLMIVCVQIIILYSFR